MKKKTLALVMAAAMTFGTMGMSTVAFAAEETPAKTVQKGTGIPTEADAVEVTVKNVAPGMTVTAYQIVEAKYNTSGFVGYDAATFNMRDEVEMNLNIADPTKPTSDEVADIVKNTALLDLLNQETLTQQDNGDYTASLEAGYWVILVSGSASDNTLNIYNPMLAGVYYSKGGSNNEMTTEHVDGTSNWTLVTENAWAKHSSIPFEKNADKETVNKGDIVKFDIPTKIPAYSSAYKSATFEITDKMFDLELDVESVKVYEVTEGDQLTEISSDNYTVKTGDDAKNDELGQNFDLIVSFNSDWILTNGGKNIVVKYSATAVNNAVNIVAHENEATLTYTNNPDGSTDATTDKEKIYTFDIDGGITADVLKKVAPGKEANTTVPLADAEFTLYKDEECTVPYTNWFYEDEDAVGISDDDGRIYFRGLNADDPSTADEDEGRYYMKETAAPDGYTLNNTVYTIDIDAVIDGEELKSWTINVYDPTTDKTAENTFTVNQSNPKGADAKFDTTNIMNTTISSLPSTGGIGTTIFTIGGCVIMIAAAGIFFVSRKKENEAK